VVAGQGTTYSSPSLAAIGNGSSIAVQGLGNSLDFYWQAVGTRPWNPEVASRLESKGPVDLQSAS